MHATPGILKRAKKFGFLNSNRPMTEEELGTAFYQGLERKIATHGSVQVEGWNGVSHLALFESLTHRYKSLEKYQGFFARQTAAGKFAYQGR